jgi:hypothetical protein
MKVPTVVRERRLKEACVHFYGDTGHIITPTFTNMSGFQLYFHDNPPPIFECHPCAMKGILHHALKLKAMVDH